MNAGPPVSPIVAAPVPGEPWSSVECGRLSGADCGEAARLATTLYELHESISPGHRFVVDFACSPRQNCPDGSPAVALIARPGWQSLAMLASFELVGEPGTRRVEALDQREVPAHVVELMKQAPADPTALWRPDLVLASPSRVEPGDSFELSFPHGYDRGLGYALEYWAGREWHFRYDLGVAVGGEPGWQEAGVPGGWEMDLVGVAEPGPDRLIIPPVAEPGAYRVCTALGVDNICALVEVDNPDAIVQPDPELTQTCADQALEFSIDYPAGWWVHPPDPEREVDACSYFGPSPFELEAGDFGQLVGGSITVRVSGGGCLGYDETPITHHRLTVDGMPGYVDEFAGFFMAAGTWYVLDLVADGGLCDGLNQGPALHAGTTVDLPGDYVENRRILDAMVRSLAFRDD